MNFIKGENYEGAFIVEELKAERNSKPYYSPHRGGQVLAFVVNRWQNPSAPHELLVGCGEGRETYADGFIMQQSVVPVFIRERREDKLWCCAGYFKLNRASDEVSEKNKRVKAFDIPAIYKILFLEEVPA